MTRQILLLVFILTVTLCAQPNYELVILGGRVIDPESGLDAIRNLGITAGRIVVVSEQPLKGHLEIDAAGSVVTPGFIDLHQHGQSPANYQAQIRDGITTSLELEIGVEDIEAWYQDRAGKSLVNHGASISHPYSRQLVMLGNNPGLYGDALAMSLSNEQHQALIKRIEQGLDQGALAVGFGIAYTPGASQEEIVEMFRIAARYDASCHVHMRTEHNNLSNLEEVIDAARESGAGLHIVHLNSSARDRVSLYLERILAARVAGLDITTEAYPYNRGSTLIQSHLFTDWQSYTDEQLREFIWIRTGETLSRETFGKFREMGGTIILPPLYQEESVNKAIASPLTAVASDGMWLSDGRAHPRSFGTFSRVLGRFVREQNILTLPEALRKMTLLPASRLEKRVPAMRNKGRIRPGADADIVVFDPATILDRGTYSDPAQSPVGIQHVIINGVLALQDGDIVEGVKAGRAVRAPQVYRDATGNTWNHPGL